MEKCIILTHRGLEPSNNNFYPESSFEAFKNHLDRGFGIEFDPNFIKDNIIVFHDSSLGRITEKKDSRNFSDLSLEEIKKINYGKNKLGSFITFQEILELIKNSKSKINALHLKGINQTKEKIDLLLSQIDKEVLKKIIIFDLKPEFAKYLKSIYPNAILAPSVAHEYDIKRYNECVNGTLISIDDAINNKNIYDWVWLDEWDTIDSNNNEKIFYTKENFDKLKKVGYKIALVTPELHGTSPALYGGESHKDAKDKETLLKRIKEILQLNPDAICSDYPEEIKNMAI